jgi:hypothetical protein
MREDLSDIIYNISPTETPFMMMIGRGTATNTTHEWSVDDLLDVDVANFNDEGDEATFAEVAQTTRIQNRSQISNKTVLITGTSETVDKAGRKSELAFQLAKRAKELKRDMETILIAGRATAAAVPQLFLAGTTTAPTRKLTPYETWMTDGLSAAWTGSHQPANYAADATAPASTDGFEPTAAVVHGTQRAFAEADLKDVIKQCWDQGGDPTVVMTGSFNKQAASAFSGNTTRFDRSEDMRLVTAIDVYVSDFGECRIVPNRFSRERSVLVITPNMWSVDYLRGFRQFPLAKTGDSEKRMLLVEYTLRASNPHASGIVADLTVA